MSEAALAQKAAEPFSEKAGGAINAATSFAEVEQYEEALDVLQVELDRNDLSPVEFATLYQLVGQYNYELNRIPQSLTAFENAISSGGLGAKDVDNLKLVIAQLMIANKQYHEGAEQLETYLTSGGTPDLKYIELLVNTWTQAEDYPRALPWAEKWFEAAAPKQRRHYDFLNFLYNNLAMQQERIDLVKEMIGRWPDDKNLWDTWVSMLANSGREDEAFEVHKMMYQAGLLTDAKDLQTLVQYHAFYDLPYQAAEILEREIELGRVPETADNLKQTASFFRQARVPERAVPYLEKAAALSNDSRVKGVIAEKLASTGACEKSETAIKTATDQGYDKAKAYMLIGNCYFDKSVKLDRLSCDLTNAQKTAAPKSIARVSALNAFKSVPESSNQSKNAQKWVQFIEAEVAAYERRCGHSWPDYTRELCYQKIKMAYDAAIFTGGFKLDDTSCEIHIADYDTKFKAR